MLEDQVASLLQRYLGNYVRGLNKEALKISVWNGDVELTNMQLKPEALNALKLPIKVKAGFLGSVKLKVPWSRLGQDPVLVHLDRIFLLAEPATSVEGDSEDALQDAKRSRIREMETKLLERAERLKTDEVNKSWLGSLIGTIIGNLKMSISNIHIRYEDGESNVGHPFAAGVTLDKLSAFTVDDNGNETFVTGGALDSIQKSVELERLAFYFDSDISPWHLDKTWEDLLPSEWSQVFKFGTKDGKVVGSLVDEHSYILEPVSGNAKYLKLRSDDSVAIGDKPLQKADVNLDDVTICLSKDGYRDMLKLADNFAAFNQRLKYAHYRPTVSVKSDPRLWWKYACNAVTDQIKKASGKLSWEQVLKYARLRKKYISLYVSLLKSNPSQAVVDDNEDIKRLDLELDIDLIVQWRMVAHRFVEQSIESDMRRQREKKSWWSFGWGNESSQDETETLQLTDEDWERLNKVIRYNEGDVEQLRDAKKDVIHTAFELHMGRNASKLIDAGKCVAELSCESLKCSGSLYAETMLLDLKLGSYCLTSPRGILAESATVHDSLSGTFVYKPFDVEVDWSFVAKASPCYVTYLKDSVDQIVKFFESSTASQALAVETAAAVQMTFDEMKRTAQEQMSRALKDHSRFLLDLDIAAPKITIPTEFCPDGGHPTKLLLDLGNLIIRTKDDHGSESPEILNLYLQFDMVLSDVSAFLVDGDYCWDEASLGWHPGSSKLSGVSTGGGSGGAMRLSMLKKTRRASAAVVSVSMCAKSENFSEKIDLSDPEWKSKYQEEFERRFELPHLSDIFKDLKPLPSTFCLKMRSPVSEEFAGGYPSDEKWHGYINNDDRVLLKVIHYSSPFSAGAQCIDPDCTWVEQWVHRAGPREEIYFKPEEVNAAIVTCGGLCPGLNDVIRQIVITLEIYGVKNIVGMPFGYRGFTDKGLKEMPLTRKVVQNIHLSGGSLLGVSRGGPSVREIVDNMEEKGTNMLFVLGGNGTHAGAVAIHDECRKRRMKVAVVGVPKTIDNDILLMDKTFGFDTAVEEAQRAINSAYIEAHSAYRGVGLVKLMGRSSGFIAMHASLASGQVDICLIPEVPFHIHGPHGILRHLEYLLDTKGSAVICVAEGAAQNLLEKTNATDASGNAVFGDIGVHLQQEIKKYFKELGTSADVKYIDPTYMLRAIRANASDGILCTVLGQNAVHGAFAGFSGITVGLCNTHYAYFPIPEVIKYPRLVDPNSRMWHRCLTSTGQPDFI